MRAVVLLLLVLVSLPAAAAPVERRPGPAVEPAPPLPGMLRGDPRLERKVTLRLVRRPLSEVVGAVGRAAGVQARVDTAIADEPAIAWFTERSARDVLHHLAQLFNYRWMRTGEDGRWRYELFQAQQAKAEEARLREAATRGALEELLRKVRLDLSLLPRSPEELTRQARELRAACERYWEPVRRLPREQKIALRKTAEYRRMDEQSELAETYLRMAQPVTRALARIAAGLTGEQWQQLLDGDRLRFSTRQEPGTLRLPERVAAELRAARPSLAMSRVSQRTPEQERELDEEERQAREQWAQARDLRVDFTLYQYHSDATPCAHWTATATLLLPGDEKVQAHPYSGGGWMLEARSLACGNGVDGPEEVTYPNRVPPKWIADRQLSAKRVLKLERPADPWADRDVDYETKTWRPTVRTRDLLPQIARAWDLDLVADAYLLDGWDMEGPPDRAEEPLYAFLNRWVLRNSRWARRGDVFHARSYTWYLDRAAEVPHRVASQWAARFRREPQLSLADAARLVLALDDEQLKRFDLTMREHGIWVGGAFNYFVAADTIPNGQREILRAYGSLPPAQQQALLRGASLSYAALPAKAQRWLRRAVQQQRSGDFGPTDPFPTDQAVLSLRAQPARRTTRQEPNAVMLFYHPPGETIDFDARIMASMDHLFLRTGVPAAPGLAPPAAGESPQLTFHLRAPGTAETTFRVLLPYVAHRNPDQPQPPATTAPPP